MNPMLAICELFFLKQQPIDESINHTCRDAIDNDRPSSVGMDSISLASVKRDESSSIPSFRLFQNEPLFHYQILRICGMDCKGLF